MFIRSDPGSRIGKNEFDFKVQVDIKSAKYVLEHSNPTLVPLSVDRRNLSAKSTFD